MFRKLRIKFIAIIMASVAIVLAVVFAGICVSEHQRSVAEVQEALSDAVDRAAMIEGIDRQVLREIDDHLANAAAEERLPLAQPDDDLDFDWDDALDGYAGDGLNFDERDLDDDFDFDFDESAYGPPRIGGREGDRGVSSIPLAAYKSTDGSTLTVLTSVTTASISDDVLDEAASRVLAAADGQGTLDDLGLHFFKRTTETATMVAFADTSNTSSWAPLAFTLAIAGLGTLAVFFVISLFLSKWALRPVREAWDSQRQFVADASHELKTPLTVILANSSILLKHPEASIVSQSQWIESTQTEAGMMQDLVAEMLELAQTEERAQLLREPVDLSDLADGETLQFESLAFERGCRFECNLEGGLTVIGDAVRLRKMVSTLIENALKYVDGGGSVDISLARHGSAAHLSIRNTGSVIAPEDLPHIFDRFYRTDKARTSGTGGFGLGLAIARETARAHGGDITCKSSPETGTVFTVTLPLAATPS